MTKILLIVMALMLTASGCAPASSASAEEGEDRSNPGQSGGPIIVEPSSVDLKDITPGAKENSGPVEAPAPGRRGSEASLIHFISLDVSKRLGIDLSAVELVESKQVTWPDGSLGCPAQGMSYTQAEVQGYQVTVKAQGQEFVYHSNGFSSFVWCNQGTPEEALK